MTVSVNTWVVASPMLHARPGASMRHRGVIACRVAMNVVLLDLLGAKQHLL